MDLHLFVWPLVGALLLAIAGWLQMNELSLTGRERIEWTFIVIILFVLLIGPSVLRAVVQNWAIRP
jgi:hypothetical protein